MAFGFKGLGWFISCAIVAPGCYIVTSQGAAEHSRLQSVEGKILTARKEIRNLETEFNTRANMAQLEQWNGQVLALAAPAPQQYLASEDALADLDRVGAQVQVAQLVVPSGTPRVTPEPAVVVQPERSASAKHPSATAQAGAMGKARTEAVAMLDDKLLADLKQQARAEQLALR